MKQLLFLATALTMSMPAFAAGLEDIKTVYLLPMSSGFDQYLAVRLTTGAVFQVVTDPQKADAVFTDHLGASFEQNLSELYGEKPKTPEQTGEEQPFARVGGGSRAKGTAFLVNRKTRDVVWSTYERPKNTTPDQLKRTADRVGTNLEKALKPK